MIRYKLKHGTDAQVATYIGRSGEILAMGPNRVPRIQDGRMPGGFALDSVAAAGPTIISPVSGSIDISRTPTLQTGVYAGNDTHTSTRWQVSTDPTFATVVFDSEEDTVNLVSINMDDVSVTLSADTSHYARVYHVGSASAPSEWSDAVEFRTISSGGTQPAEDGIILVPSISTNTYNYGAGGVAINADGNRAVLRSFSGTDAKLGVFAKSAGVWIENSILDIGNTNNHQAYGMDMSSDGSAIVVANRDAHIVGYGENGGVWAETGPTVRPSGPDILSKCERVVISGDGSTAILALPDYTVSGVARGAVYQYELNSGTWTEIDEIATVAPVDGGRFGKNLAISKSGTVLAIVDNSNVTIYNRPSIIAGVNNWTVEDTIPSQAVGWGSAISVSGDGQTIAIASPDSYVVNIYTNSGGTWSASTGGNATIPSSEGHFIGDSVALSHDGTVLAVGAVGYTQGTDVTGAVYVFKLNSGTWVLAKTLVDSNGASGLKIGGHVDISDNGNTICASAEGHVVSGQGTVGAAYIFDITGV